jgi:hypothetical protein
MVKKTTLIVYKNLLKNFDNVTMDSLINESAQLFSLVTLS